MPFLFPAEDPLENSFSTPSSDGLETMSSDENSISSTRPPLSQCPSFWRRSTARCRSLSDSSPVHQGLFPILEPKVSSLRSRSPDTSFSETGGTYVTKKLLSVMSTYRSISPQFRSGDVDSRNVSTGESHSYNNSTSNRSNIHLPSISNVVMDRSSTPQTTHTNVGELFGSSYSMNVSPTQASRMRTMMRTPKPPTLSPISHIAITGVFIPNPFSVTEEREETILVDHDGGTAPLAKCISFSKYEARSATFVPPVITQNKKVNPHRMKCTAERVRNKHRREQFSNATLQGFIGGDLDEKGVVRC